MLRKMSCMEITYKEYKRIRKKRKGIFCLVGRHKTETISAIFWPKPKKHQIRNQLPRHDRMAKEPSHATVPLNYIPPLQQQMELPHQQLNSSCHASALGRQYLLSITLQITPAAGYSLPARQGRMPCWVDSLYGHGPLWSWCPLVS